MADFLKNCGIVGYGGYIPYGRITIEEIAKVWKKEPLEIISSLGIKEKAVPAIDEDTATISIEAAMIALQRAEIKANQIQAIYIGSESHPYSVNPTSTIVGEMLGIGNNYIAADMEFACKAGTAGLQAVSGLIESGKIDYGLVIGADCSQSKPHDALEYSAGAGAGAFILGNNKKETTVRILDFESYSSDTPDFWRRDGVSYPSHGGRFTGEPAYFTHVFQAAKLLLNKHHLSAKDFTYCVFHMPNGKFPLTIAKRLGFTYEQIKPSYISPQIGNPYSGSSLLGLAATLDIAKEKELIFMVSYGSGAGSDAFIFETTEILARKRKKAKGINYFIENKEYLPYHEYLKRTHKI